MLRHPIHSFITCWNCKAGALSVILRVPVYVITTVRHGWQAATLAGAVEAVFSATFAGVYAAFTEAVRDAVPESIVAILLLTVLPAIALALDALLHYAMRTPNLVAGVSASLVVSVLSSAFNWDSMQRGALVVGPAARPFASDIAALPLLLARFLWQPFRWLRRARKTICEPAVEE